MMMITMTMPRMLRKTTTTTTTVHEDASKEEYCNEHNKVVARLHWDASDSAVALRAIDGSVPRSATTVPPCRRCHGEYYPDCDNDYYCSCCCFDVCESMVVMMMMVVVVAAVVFAAGGNPGRVSYCHTIGLGCCACKETIQLLISSSW